MFFIFKCKASTLKVSQLWSDLPLKKIFIDSWWVVYGRKFVDVGTLTLEKLMTFQVGKSTIGPSLDNLILSSLFFLPSYISLLNKQKKVENKKSE